VLEVQQQLQPANRLRKGVWEEWSLESYHCHYYLHCHKTMLGLLHLEPVVLYSLVAEIKISKDNFIY